MLAIETGIALEQLANPQAVDLAQLAEEYAEFAASVVRRAMAAFLAGSGRLADGLGDRDGGRGVARAFQWPGRGYGHRPAAPAGFGPGYPADCQDRRAPQ